MKDLFEFGSVTDTSGAYGSTGDLKKTQYIMQLLGDPADADTLKCILTAAEKGIELESAVLDMSLAQQDGEDYRAISPFGIMPALKEDQYIVVGDAGIVSFIEGRGLGNRLAPRNAAVLAQQIYWVDIACSHVAPHIEILMQEQLLAVLVDPSYQADKDKISSAKEALSAPLDAIEAQLANKQFIVGDYTYADIHWTAYIHLLQLAGESALIKQRPNLNAWLARIKTHKSFSGQDLIAYELLPTVDDIKAKKLNDVVCGEF